MWSTPPVTRQAPAAAVEIAAAALSPHRLTPAVHVTITTSASADVPWTARSQCINVATHVAAVNCTAG